MGSHMKPREACGRRSQKPQLLPGYTEHGLGTFSVRRGEGQGSRPGATRGDGRPRGQTMVGKRTRPAGLESLSLSGPDAGTAMRHPHGPDPLDSAEDITASSGSPWPQLHPAPVTSLHAYTEPKSMCLPAPSTHQPGSNPGATRTTTILLVRHAPSYVQRHVSYPMLSSFL